MYVSPLLVQAACMCIACIARISDLYFPPTYFMWQIASLCLLFLLDNHIRSTISLPPPSHAAFQHDGFTCNQFPWSLSSRFRFQLSQIEQLFWWGAASIGRSGEFSRETWILSSHPGRGRGRSCDCPCDLYYTIVSYFCIPINLFVFTCSCSSGLSTINCCGRGWLCNYSNQFLHEPHTIVYWGQRSHWSTFHTYFRHFIFNCHYAHKFVY